VRVQPYDDRFDGEVYGYRDIADAASAFDPTGYTMLHGVCPDWDNVPRRPHGGLTFVGSTPATYGSWLESACAKVMRNNGPDERIVFINAWNEWAEAAHLEPDRHNGLAYLRETARVLGRVSEANPAGESAQPAVLTASRAGARRIRAEQTRLFVRRVRNKLARIVESFARFLRPL
jgi:hypothetical protein